MCGICGVYGESDPDKTSLMLEAILHRGPDGNAVKNFPWGSLGFCRLDIFGSSGINQPAISGNKTAVVFNGEIYNFDELKALLPGAQKVSDEVGLILGLYLSYGVECFKLLKGMFAISIMTPDELILARDAVGIKPLVYSAVNKKIYFASEIKSLIRIKEDMVEIDEEALAEASVFGFIFDMEKTMFKGIGQVPPGSYISFNGNKIQLEIFSNFNPSFNGDEVWEQGDTQAKLADLMDSASRLYLNHSKHPQAIYLSGDSIPHC